ncbi:serine/threonine protein kinase [Kribbella sindirgiensis]|uniref:Serine/threonine protein kinase n=2 Tax=Kribbella sindirgiensis TaxID=1124744 RepID=A0A4R0I011_9ACTN|nr:serine/threonine protein kinase [Kribbella sindirgiensis]
MGSVWRAWDLRRSAYVAAKVLGQHDAGTLLRFVREQSVRIQHPHVVAPHGWAADDDKVVFAMDLVRGGSVATLLGDHGPLPPAYVAVLLDQLLQALSAVHAAGVVHRDLKPANLLLDATGTGRPHLRLSDFGVAGLIDEPRMTRNSTVLGTPGYLAPEQLSGEDPDPRQDLYAVGAVAHELLTGDRPTGSRPPTAGPLAAFIHTCTAPNPTDRPATARAAARLLAETGTLPPAGTLPWTTHPDAPEVFDQLPPLPFPWTPTGPAHPTGTTPPAKPTQPPQAAGPLQPTAETANSTVGTAQVVGSAGSVEPGGRAGDTRAGVAQEFVVEGSSVSQGARVEGAGRRRGLVWLAVGCFVGAAGLIGSAVWVLVR